MANNIFSKKSVSENCLVKPYVSKEIVPFSSSKCSVCLAHQQLVHKRTIQQFHKKCALQQSLVQVQAHVHHHLPICCCSCQTHDHHTTLQSWTKHMLPAKCLEIRKTQSRRPSRHLAQSGPHASITLIAGV